MTPDELTQVIKAMESGMPRVQQTFNFNAPIGQQIAHVDKIEAHFDKDMGMSFAQGPTGDSASSTSDELTNQLLPIFFNDEEEVRQFVKGIRNADDRLVTNLVRDLVAKGKIIERAKNRMLYTILHDHQLYHSSETNWNKQLR